MTKKQKTAEPPTIALDAFMSQAQRTSLDALLGCLDAHVVNGMLAHAVEAKAALLFEKEHPTRPATLYAKYQLSPRLTDCHWHCAAGLADRQLNGSTYQIATPQNKPISPTQEYALENAIKGDVDTPRLQGVHRDPDQAAKAMSIPAKEVQLDGAVMTTRGTRRSLHVKYKGLWLPAGMVFSSAVATREERAKWQTYPTLNIV